MSKRRSTFGPDPYSSQTKRRVPLNGTKESNEPQIKHGKIERITLTNFMCHGNLSVHFSPRINFLVGSNGSGKSAIMAALTIGLGAKARTTNRCPSIKQLIKNGEHSAKIEIVLSNQGALAFEPDNYGNNITIIRTIHQSGSSTYVLKSATGTVVSKKFDELQRILTYFNIHVDNPVFMLNQDNSRDFLKELDPSKNYDLFLKATRIQHLTEKLQNCAEQRETHKHEFEISKVKVTKILEEINSLTEKLNRLQNLEIIKNSLKELQIKYAWKKTTEHENALKNLAKEIENSTSDQLSLAEKCQSEDKLKEKLAEDIKQLEMQLREKETQFHNENVILSELQKCHARKNEEIMNITSITQSLKKRLSNKMNQLQELQTHIESTTNKSETLEDLRHTNEMKLKKLEEKRMNNMKEEVAAQDELKKIFAEKVEINSKISEINQQKNELNLTLQSTTQRINNLKSGTKNKLAIYGTNAMTLREEIQKAYQKGMFSALPRGPLGQYVEVPNEKYRDIVETQLKPLLHSFLVNSKEDLQVIQKILRTKLSNYHPPIIVTKFLDKVYNVKSGMVIPPRDTKLLMNLIKCNDPVVMNCIIDRVQVETVLLTESKSTAEHITAESENVPRNLSRVLVTSLGLEYYPDPHYRMYSFTIQPAKFIQVNIEDCLKHEEAKSAALLNKLKTITDKQKQLQERYKTVCRQYDEQHSMVERIASNSLELKEEITALKNYDYPDHNEIDILVKELDDTKRECSKLEEMIKLNKNKLNTDEESNKSIEDKTTAQKEQMRNVERSISETKQRIDEIRSQMLSFTESFKMYRQQLQDITLRIKELMQKQNKWQEILEKFVQKAAKYGPRVDSLESTDELISLIDDVQKKLESHRPIQDDPKKLQDLKNAKTELYEKKNHEIELLEATLAALDNSFKIRLCNLKKDRDDKTRQLKESFDMFLQLRSFDGSITVDHDAKTLDVKIIPRDSHLEGAVSSTKALSGGERSFSTVALLLSLWSCADHPFYFLDEYDVYTDEVNRAFLTELLIREGAQNPNRQYVFLTPLSMEIEKQDYIKIHRLAPPVRD